MGPLPLTAQVTCPVFAAFSWGCLTSFLSAGQDRLLAVNPSLWLGD